MRRPPSSPKSSRVTRSDVRAYRWCGLTIRTDIDIPELVPAANAGEREWVVRLGTGRAPRRDGRRWFHRWRFPDGRRWVAFARDPAGYLLRFPALADFDVRPAGRLIECYPQSAPPHTVRHLLLDQVLPLIVGTRDSLALHGSVVATSAGAIAFLGESGLGKSTLAATLGHRGCQVLSDDCCVLVRRSLGEGGLMKRQRGFCVVPSYPGVRLNPDSLQRTFGPDAGGDRVSHYSQKRRAGGRELFEFSEAEVPLRQLYVMATRAELDAAPAIAITQPSKRDAMYALIDFTFHLDIGCAPRIRETFELAGAILDHHRVRKLTFPWNLSESEMLADAVLNDACQPLDALG